MKSERIYIRRAIVDIVKTPEEFPLGTRGQRPIRFTLQHPEDVEILREARIPGVLVRGAQVECAWDAAPIIAEMLGEPEALNATLTTRLSCPIPLPGKARYDELGLQQVRRDYQGEGARFLLRRSYALLGDVPRSGKTLQSIMVCTLVGAKCTLILCNSLGKYVWAEEIAKWTKQSSALLFGRGGDEVRLFCTTCNGRGSVEVASNETPVDPPTRASCKACRTKSGRSLGETVITVRELQPETGMAYQHEEPSNADMAAWHDRTAKWEIACAKKLAGRQAKENARRAEWEKKDPKRRKEYTPLKQPALPIKPDRPPGKLRGFPYCLVPARFRCPKHEDEVDTRPRQCFQCRREMLDVLEQQSFIICNYDILAAQRDKTETGVSIVRSDLPGWGSILARLKFDVALADECHRLRGWAPKTEKTKKSRRELANDVCAEIPRVYGLTGTPVYGFVRDLWGQLDFLSGGLWS